MKRQARLLLATIILCFAGMVLLLDATKQSHGVEFGENHHNNAPAETLAKKSDSAVSQSTNKQRQGNSDSESSPDLEDVDPGVRPELQHLAAEHGLSEWGKGSRARGATPNTTVVVMSYPKSSRFHLLAKIIAKVLKWPFVVRVVLVWNGDLELLPPSIAAFNTKESELVVLPQERNRVDNRWRIAAHIPTQSAINMDDDIDLTEEGARCLLSVWEAAPMSLVGVDVRSHFHHYVRSGGKTQVGPHGDWGYAARDTSNGYKTYSISLPRAVIANKAFHVAYDAAWRNDATHIRKIVDELECDDVAFNFVALNSTQNAGVIYAKAKYRPYPESHSSSAMFNRPGMKAKRQQCINRLASESFGGNMPLRPRRWHVLCDVDG